MSRALSRGAVIAVLVLAASPSRAAEIADFVGKVVVDVQLVRDGRPVQDRSTQDLVETRRGQPLSMRQVRESVTHLFSLGEFTDVHFRVSAAPDDPGGVVLRYDLIPRPAAVDVDVRGVLGRSRQALLDLIDRRFGRAVGVAQIPEVVIYLEELYRESGRYAARIVPPVGPDGRRLVFEIDQGPAARVGRVDLLGVPDGDEAGVLARLGLGEGAAYDPVEVERRLAEYETDVRSRGYYEARFRHDATPSPEGLTVDLVIEVETGSPVTILFSVDGAPPLAMASDPVPGLSLPELVPLAREGSVDEDLLEDSSLRVENRLRSLGHRNAAVTHDRRSELGALSIVFAVDRGPQFRVVEVRFEGDRLVAELGALFGVAAAMPLVMADVDAGVAALTTRYRQLGYRAAQVTAAVLEREAIDADGPSAIVPVSLVVEIVEGPLTTVGAITFDDADTVISTAELRTVVASASGQPFYAPQVLADGNAVRARYLNEGYESVQVDVQSVFDERDTTATVTFVIHAGPQVIVEHVLVIGNRQIGTSSLLEEVAYRPGEPFGLDRRDETRRRLTALGLFRGVIEIREFSHGDRNRRDVVVYVEEAPATTVGYGGGLELSQRLRASEGGVAGARLELAPRGFFEIGRRNLWGKNRSLNLFTRVSVRRTDDVDAEVPESSLGFNEYRFLLNFREPRAFGQSSDLFVSGFIDQAIRPSFDLYSRGVNVELQRAVGFTMTGSVIYSYGQNRVTNNQIPAEDQPLVDRLFPTVTLSSVSGSLVRDTRDDQLDPTDGSLLAVDGKTAFRGIGSEVGFARAIFQGRYYRQLPGALVFAAGVRLGLARAFTRTVADFALPMRVIDNDGVLTQEFDQGDFTLPASERFFAGGDTTVRGFALDRLGDVPTINDEGFPIGGNAMIVLNSELRMPVTGALQVVGFLDAGNVFDFVSSLSLARIRGAAGFGVRYRSPIGPIRVDLGFKLDRLEFAGERERLTALHVSIGQAF